MKNMYKLFGIVLIILALVGCQQAEPTPATSAGTDTSAAVPPTDRQGGTLDTVSRLALGTLELEEGSDAVTATQAAALLPLWQIIQGGTLKSGAETEAVVKQIEGNMTPSQLAAVEAMALTYEDVQAWMQEQGIEVPARPGGQSGQGGPGAFGDLSEEERTQMREQMQSLTPEERATRLAEMGIERPQGAQGGQGSAPGGGGAMGGNLLLEPLVQLLTERAG